MNRAAFLGREEHRHHTSAAAASIEGSQRGEPHALQELHDFAHAVHVAVARAFSGTMKRAPFQGATV